jgi:hypothetical protein
VYPIFTRTGVGCPGCHDSTPPAGLNLSSASTAYANLVNVNATQCSPARLRVAPGSPSTSYLINKLTGTDMCTGLRMPRGRNPLPAADIDLIRAWITGNAPP